MCYYTSKALCLFVWRWEFIKIFQRTYYYYYRKNVDIKEVSSLGNWPSARIGHTLAFWKSFIFLIGGVSDNSRILDEVWMLDFKLFPENPNWKKFRFPLFQPRSYLISYIEK